MRRIGFFGGSFDPIHFGHIGLAVDLMEAHGLDEVLFCPAYCSPFKLDQPPIASGSMRLEMLKLALDHPKFKICTLEIEREGTSFTIDTLQNLKKKGEQFRLLLSEEAAQNLDKWKDFKQIVQIAPPLIGSRDTKISSTQIRERLQKCLYCGHLIPAKALDYIKKNQVYCR